MEDSVSRIPASPDPFAPATPVTPRFAPSLVQLIGLLFSRSLRSTVVEGKPGRGVFQLSSAAAVAPTVVIADQMTRKSNRTDPPLRRCSLVAQSRESVVEALLLSSPCSTERCSAAEVRTSCSTARLLANPGAPTVNHNSSPGAHTALPSRSDSATAEHVTPPAVARTGSAAEPGVSSSRRLVSVVLPILVLVLVMSGSWLASSMILRVSPRQASTASVACATAAESGSAGPTDNDAVELSTCSKPTPASTPANSGSSPLATALVIDRLRSLGPRRLGTATENLPCDHDGNTASPTIDDVGWAEGGICCGSGLLQVSAGVSNSSLVELGAAVWPCWFREMCCQLVMGRLECCMM